MSFINVYSVEIIFFLYTRLLDEQYDSHRRVDRSFIYELEKKNSFILKVLLRQGNDGEVMKIIF